MPRYNPDDYDVQQGDIPAADSAVDAVADHTANQLGSDEAPPSEPAPSDWVGTAPSGDSMRPSGAYDPSSWDQPPSDPAPSDWHVAQEDPSTAPLERQSMGPNGHEVGWREPDHSDGEASGEYGRR